MSAEIEKIDDDNTTWETEKNNIEHVRRRQKQDFTITCVVGQPLQAGLLGLEGLYTTRHNSYLFQLATAG